MTMKIGSRSLSFFYCFLLLPLISHEARSMDRSTSSLLKACYTAVKGTDPEYAQGAIERNEVAHREVQHFVWLLQVEPPGDIQEWARRLNDAVTPEHGSFVVERASPEEEELVRTGKVVLQK